MLHCQNITKNYVLNNTEISVLRNINLKVERGELIAILGRSGSGKTSLLNILGCLERPSTGNYYLNKQNTAAFSPQELAKFRNEKIGFVFQHFQLLPYFTALENVSLPLVPRAYSYKKRQKLAMAALDKVNLIEKQAFKSTALSGGQQQRCAIARALVTQPDLILADEPTGNLDRQASVDILQHFQFLASQGTSIILVTHDKTIAGLCQKIYYLHEGQLEQE